MATGKTTIGNLLAKTIGFDFIDMDQLIEEIEGVSISNIFNIKGETYFRDKESEVLDLLKSRSNTVIATGGGVVVSKINRQKLKHIGRVFHLQSSPQWILTNLNRSKTVRPLLMEEINPMEKVIELLNKREELYKDAAEFTVLVDEKSPDEIVNNIISIIRSTD